MSPKTVFSSVALVIALGSLEKSIVTTPLPIIGAELNAGAALTWVVTAYLLTSTASTPLWGKIYDLYGRRPIFQAAIIIFLIVGTNPARRCAVDRLSHVNPVRG